MITVNKLNKSFGQLTAVNNLSFKINTGEIVGFLGPNGAGKTTTMRLLTGFLSPDSGNIKVNNIAIADDIQAVQTQIGYLPENNPLYKDMLVSEMFDFSADLKQIPAEKRKEAFDFAVSAVSISDVFYRPIGELSKGYKQRVGMALALMHKPQILIMDEPTEGLDPNQRTEIRALIKELAHDRTILLSTHVMQEATAVANRILIINQGRLVADGTPDQLIKGGQTEKTIHLEIEGKGVIAGLKSIKHVDSIDTTKLNPSRYQAVLTVKTKKDIQPELSKLIAKNKWVVWKLVEKENQLEDVFQALTQTK